MSETVLAKAAAYCYQASEPSVTGSALGQLIVTDKRLIFIKYQGTIHLKTPDYSGNVEEELKLEGSFFIPISDVLDASVTSKKVGLTHGFPYLRVRLSDTDYSFNLVMGGDKASEALSTIAVAIDKAKTSEGTTQSEARIASPTLNSSPKAPSPSETMPVWQKPFAFCPNCGEKLPNQTAKFCPFCGDPLLQSAETN